MEQIRNQKKTSPMGPIVPIIRRPNKQETDGINHFFKLVLEDTFKKNGILHLQETLQEEIDDKQRCLEQDFDTEGQIRHFLVAELEGSIIGTIEYGPANALILKCTHNELAGVPEIGTVFVHPEFQFQGIGKMLLRGILKELNEIGAKEFCLDSGYQTAQAVWRKRFGEPQYYLKDYWGENAPHMIWRLDTAWAMGVNTKEVDDSSEGVIESDRVAYIGSYTNREKTGIYE